MEKMSFGAWLQEEYGVTWNEYDELYTPWQQSEMREGYEKYCEALFEEGERSMQ